MKHKNGLGKKDVNLPIIFDKFERQYNVLKEKLGVKNEINLFSPDNKKRKTE